MDLWNFRQSSSVIDTLFRPPCLLWRISLSNQFSDDLMVYATYARGFKGGAFNDQIGGFAPFGADLAAFRDSSIPSELI